jgi:hypothetical protein
MLYRFASLKSSLFEIISSRYQHIEKIFFQQLMTFGIQKCNYKEAKPKKYFEIAFAHWHRFGFSGAPS